MYVYIYVCVCIHKCISKPMMVTSFIVRSCSTCIQTETNQQIVMWAATLSANRYLLPGGSLAKRVEQVRIVLRLKVMDHSEGVLTDIRKALGGGQVPHNGMEAPPCCTGTSVAGRNTSVPGRNTSVPGTGTLV